MPGPTTAELVLGPYWRDRIKHELKSTMLTDAARSFYDVLAGLAGTPTYAEAWMGVCATLPQKASDIRKTTAQSIFDLLWQTLCDDWDPNGDNYADAARGVAPGISPITQLKLKVA